MDDTRYYRHSGRFSPGGIVGALGLGLPAAVLMAFVYAYAIVYIPIIGIVSFILTGGFAAVVGAVVGLMLHTGKVRNTLVSYLTALPVALVALWASWVAWVYALLRRGDAEISLLGLTLDPVGLWQVIGVINEKGAWSFKGATPTGGVLWFLWACEALIIVGVSMAMAEGMVAEPFCEDCQTWCEEQKSFALLGPATQEELVPRLELSDFVALKGLPAATASAFTRLDLHQCTQCRATLTLTGKAITVTQKGGKTETDEKDLFRLLKLSTSQLASLKQVLEQRAQAEAEAEKREAAAGAAAGGTPT